MSQSFRSTSALLHVAYMFTGIVATMLGPLLPELASNWRIGDQQSGYLFTIQFAVAFVSAVATGFLLRYTTSWRLAQTGYVLMAAGTIGLLAPSASMGYLAVGLYGLGLGLNIVSSNLVASALKPGDTASALNIINVCYSLGAVGAPPLIGWFRESGLVQWWIVGLPIVLLALVVAGQIVPRPPAKQPSEDAPSGNSSGALARRWVFAMLSATILFLYVGVETSWFGWMPTYLQRMDPQLVLLAASSPSGFWGGILLGRLCAPWGLHRMGSSGWMTVGMLVALVSGVFVWWTTDAVAAWIGCFVAGLGLSSIFPTTVAVFLRNYGKGASELAGSLFAIAGLGGAALPAVMGEISKASDSLRTAMLALPATTLILLACHFYNQQVVLRQRRN
jgi:FHS family glucose/mannose:H+ symporter-like MFS transporter